MPHVPVPNREARASTRLRRDRSARRHPRRARSRLSIWAEVRHRSEGRIPDRRQAGGRAVRAPPATPERPASASRESPPKLTLRSCAKDTVARCVTRAKDTAAAGASSPMNGTCPWPISESLSLFAPAALATVPTSQVVRSSGSDVTTSSVFRFRASPFSPRTLVSVEAGCQPTISETHARACLVFWRFLPRWDCQNPYSSACGNHATRGPQV